MAVADMAGSKIKTFGPKSGGGTVAASAEGHPGMTPPPDESGTFPSVLASPDPPTSATGVSLEEASLGGLPALAVAPAAIPEPPPGPVGIEEPPPPAEPPSGPGVITRGPAPEELQLERRARKTAPGAPKRTKFFVSFMEVSASQPPRRHDTRPFTRRARVSSRAYGLRVSECIDGGCSTPRAWRRGDHRAPAGRLSRRPDGRRRGGARGPRPPRRGGRPALARERARRTAQGHGDGRAALLVSGRARGASAGGRARARSAGHGPGARQRGPLRRARVGLGRARELRRDLRGGGGGHGELARGRRHRRRARGRPRRDRRGALLDLPSVLAHQLGPRAPLGLGRPAPEARFALLRAREPLRL